MTNIFVIGATGGVGHRLCPMLIENGHNVIGLYRSPEQSESLKQSGVTPVHGDLMTMTVAQLTDMTKSSDVIVFSAGAAGSGIERTAEIDGQGPVKMIQAAKNNGIKRVYLVSAFPESARGGNLGDAFEFYMKVKKKADTELAKSGLDWVIVRPGTLLNEEADDGVSLGLAIDYGTVKRGNVAAVLSKLIDTPEVCREIIELTDGEQPVEQAIENFVEYR